MGKKNKKAAPAPEPAPAAPAPAPAPAGGGGGGSKPYDRPPLTDLATQLGRLGGYKHTPTNNVPPRELAAYLITCSRYGSLGLYE